jgi:hypothetical protein
MVDSLVLSSSLFLVPINLAAQNAKWDLMNLFIFLMGTSWVHHSNMHMQVSRSNVYSKIDILTCYVAIFYTFMWALLWTNVFYYYLTCLTGVTIMHFTDHNENNYYKRGLKNYKWHVKHILMHVFACTGFIFISLETR